MLASLVKTGLKFPPGWLKFCGGVRRNRKRSNLKKQQQQQQQTNKTKKKQTIFNKYKITKSFRYTKYFTKVFSDPKFDRTAHRWTATKCMLLPQQTNVKNYWQSNIVQFPSIVSPYPIRKIAAMPLTWRVLKYLRQFSKYSWSERVAAKIWIAMSMNFNRAVLLKIFSETLYK